MGARGIIPASWLLALIVLLAPRLPRLPSAEEEAAAPPADKVTLKDGKTVEGEVIDITDQKVVLLGGKEKKERRTYPRKAVEAIERAASPALLDFFERKLKEYGAAGSAAELRKLAEFCAAKKILPERRRALREALRIEPEDAAVRIELGHAKLEGQWVDEDAVLAKVKEGYEVVGGELVKRRTAVATKRELGASTYRIIERKGLTAEERKKLEKARVDRIRSAQKFLAEKAKEYIGIPWEKRHKLKTAHFEIHCNSTLNVARAYGALMELIRSKLEKMFSSKIHRNLRAPVFIYASQEDFMTKDNFGRWGGRGIGGYYNPSSQAITAYHGTFGFTGTTFSVLCHEGTHYYQGLVLKEFDNIPMWLIEGLAVYFGDGSIFDPKAVKMEIGKIPRDRLAHIQEKMLLKRHQPVEKLVTMKRGGLGGFTGSHYADAWALIYFLVNSGDKGTKLLTDYWRVGLERLLTKKDFTDLAEKYFGGVKTLETQYIQYILGLEMPSAGRVAGDYFLSDIFQFDFKAPGDDWQFFEDREDKKMLIGLLHPGSEGEDAEVRVYYQNNDSFLESDGYMEGYSKLASTVCKDYKQEPVKISALNGFKLSYVAPSRKALDFVALPDFLAAIAGSGSPASKAPKPEEKPGAWDVVEFKLIQIDGLVTIVCSAPQGSGARYASVFDRMNENFTLTFTRRW